MSIRETTDKVVTHVKKHKEAYIVGALGVLGITLTILVMKGQQAKFIQSGNENATLNYKSTINSSVSIKIKSPGNAGNILQDENGTVYTSQNRAAKALGVTKQAIQRHLQGDIPNLKGHVLKKIVDGQVEYELVRD